MSEEDPLDKLRRHSSLNTGKSRVSSKPIDAAEETFMGASLAPKSSDQSDEALASSPQPPPALMGSVPRRRQKKSSRSKSEIDPSELAKFATDYGKTTSKEAEVIAEEELAKDDATLVSEDVKDKAQGGGLDLTASPSPPPVLAHPVQSPSPSPQIASPSPPIPVDRKSLRPMSQIQPVAIASPVVEAKESIVGDGENDANLELENIKIQLLQKDQLLADYNALAEHLLPPGSEPNAENLALFIQSTLERVEQCNVLEEQRDCLQQQLEDAKKNTPSNDSFDQASQLDQLSTKLAGLMDEKDGLANQLQSLQKSLQERDFEIGELKKRIEDVPKIQVASLEELDQQMQSRFKETADFIKEMEEFLKEHQDEAEADVGGSI